MFWLFFLARQVVIGIVPYMGVRGFFHGTYLPLEGLEHAFLLKWVNILVRQRSLVIAFVHRDSCQFNCHSRLVCAVLNCTS